MWVSRKEFDRLNERLVKAEDALRDLKRTTCDVYVPTKDPAATGDIFDGFARIPIRDCVQALAKMHLKADPPCNKKASLV